MCSQARLPRYFLILLISLLLAACGGSEESTGSSPPQKAAKPARDPAKTVELLFIYGSEKKKWIKDVTDAFNASRHKTQDGKDIYVNAVPMGSGESVDVVLSGEQKAHLLSPASRVFVTLANAEAEGQGAQPVLPDTDNLVLSPVVIAMWKPMAEALGWGQKPIGWGDVLEMAKNAEGWKAYGHPEWGRFKFGHTHPEYSNSGLISLLAQTYAATGKQTGLRRADVSAPETAEYLHAIQQSIIHYGRSTGFFGRKLMANGPTYLSAAVLYENMVIESYSHQNLEQPIVAIYPKEGTFWSDHPAGIVDRPWVTPEHREAGKIYLKYLLAKPQQEKALQYGFRPADVSVPPGAPLDIAHGVNPDEPQAVLRVPSAKIIRAVQALWQEQKKPANVGLVVDISGSMNAENKIGQARNAGLELVALLRDADHLSILAFNHELHWLTQNAAISEKKTILPAHIGGLLADGGTSLYDATATGYEYLSNNPQPDKISALIVLSDGKDTNSQLKLADLLGKLQFDSDQRPVRVFTIGYGSGADMEILEQISNATQAKAYKGDTANIARIFREISTFF